MPGSEKPNVPERVEPPSVTQVSDVDLDRVLDAMPVGVSVIDAEGRILLANATLLSLFGYRREELVGQAVEVLVPEALRASSRVRSCGLRRAAARARDGRG